VNGTMVVANGRDAAGHAVCPPHGHFEPLAMEEMRDSAGLAGTVHSGALFPRTRGISTRVRQLTPRRARSQQLGVAIHYGIEASPPLSPAAGSRLHRLPLAAAHRACADY